MNTDTDIDIDNDDRDTTINTNNNVNNKSNADHDSLQMPLEDEHKLDDDEDLEDLMNLQNTIDDDDDNNNNTISSNSNNNNNNNSNGISNSLSHSNVNSNHSYNEDIDDDNDDDDDIDTLYIDNDEYNNITSLNDDSNTDINNYNNNGVDTIFQSNKRKKTVYEKSSLSLPPPTTTTTTTTTTSTTSTSSTSSSNLNIDLNTALALNLEYQKTIKKYLENIEIAMEKNKDLLVKARNLSSATPPKPKSTERKYGSPFFQTENGDTPPDNPDTTFLKQNYGAMPMYFKSKKWTKNDCQSLAGGIREKNMQLTLFKISERNMSRQEYQKEMSNVSKITKTELEMNLDGINWESICCEHLSGRSALECELRWKNHDHPSINKEPFTKEEDKKLLELAKKYEGHRWFDICRELGTARTAIQCCQRYQRSLNTKFMKREWTKEEDEILKREYNKYTNVGGEKSWQIIAEALEGRTGQQCLHRWQKTLDPSIKRGRWTEEEDELLRKAVELYGKGNWILIKNHVPGRTDMQCRERWCNVVDPVLVKNAWTPEEDNHLRALVEKNGIGKWALVAKEMISRTDNQCWRRWKQLYSKTTFLEEYKGFLSKKKEMIVSNFVGREKERPAFTIDDFVPPEKIKEMNELALSMPATMEKRGRGRAKGSKVASNCVTPREPPKEKVRGRPPKERLPKLSKASAARAASMLTSSQSMPNTPVIQSEPSTPSPHSTSASDDYHSEPTTPLNSEETATPMAETVTTTPPSIPTRGRGRGRGGTATRGSTARGRGRGGAAKRSFEIMSEFKETEETEAELLNEIQEILLQQQRNSTQSDQE